MKLICSEGSDLDKMMEATGLAADGQLDVARLEYLFQDHCAVMRGHLPNSSWPRHRRRGGETVPSLVLFLLHFHDARRVRTCAVCASAAGGSRGQLEGSARPAKAGPQEKAGIPGQPRENCGQGQEVAEGAESTQEEVESDLTRAPSAATRAQKSRRAHEVAAHVRRASWLSRTSCPQEFAFANDNSDETYHNQSFTSRCCPLQSPSRPLTLQNPSIQAWRLQAQRAAPTPCLVLERLRIAPSQKSAIVEVGGLSASAVQACLPEHHRSSYGTSFKHHHIEAVCLRMRWSSGYPNRALLKPCKLSSSLMLPTKTEPI